MLMPTVLLNELLVVSMKWLTGGGCRGEGVLNPVNKVHKACCFLGILVSYVPKPFVTYSLVKMRALPSNYHFKDSRHSGLELK